ncbi:hypothetical protein C2S51_022627 [Perilla frutescens var. frutescens]|nr:hypothetical protein C2S51_022627 [Perilla frutescens var. frutescens]
MGGCASKPKVLKAEKAPPPLEAQSPAAENVEVQAQAKSAAEEVKVKAEAEAAPQDKTDEVETKNDEPHVDFSEPDADETKEADKEEVVPVESKPTETIEKAVEEVTEEKKEVV